ncbi:TPA: restriction endonuclease subunit S [Enterobacter hormaechei subsp. steigerwaltii]|uniref:restriction endonuclease subunit S n=1 Tax=Enterobacter cloacae complex TaxID=354276 RepID=UPI0005EEDD9B|nr:MULTISPECIES: restriction endonuclease subunit S [Enterobacter cloacae complex]ELX8426447.1 restriction endonuclease subunit S [Enterobacter hormaechei subsp. hoffmannii]HAY4553698.1 restriction endonuclease subunit S [Escherichia coli]EKP1097805.1 restriction endonuclease subunit S [Enterobacter hormaechei]EKS6525403.1 restriction endonuclease subunit S [Enterobacter hormaechei]EKU5013849.1 restriction endonuclease subunit S [Enterobacter hormaechei]
MVPKGWKKRDLHKLITIKHGFAFKSEYFSNDGQYVLLTPGSFNESGGFRNQGPKTKFYSGPIPNGYLLSKGDLLLAMTEQAEGLLGSPLFVPEDNKYLHNQRLGLVEINCPDKICSDFLYLLFNHADSRKQITEQSTGTKVKHTSPDRLCSVIGLIPPLLEQKKIAQILSTWDKAISVTEKLLANSQQQKKALMQQLLTGKKRLLDDNGNNFHGEWKSFQIGTLLKEIKRPVQWNDNDEYSLLSVKRRSEGVVLREKLKGHQILTKKMNYVKSGDFLISKMQVVHGATGLVTSEFNNHHISDSYIVLNSRNPSILDIQFFSWICKQKIMYHKAYLCSYGVHIEKMTFNLQMYLQEKVCIPKTSEEQQKIATVLSAADAEISILEKKLACLKDEKKALMQQLLTGKRRVSLPVKVEEKESVSA